MHCSKQRHNKVYIWEKYCQVEKKIIILSKAKRHTKLFKLVPFIASKTNHMPSTREWIDYAVTVKY